MTSGKQAAINAALADVGNSYATGWNQPGECLVSVRRWLAAGGINFGYGGPNSGYVASGATQVSWSNVQPAMLFNMKVPIVQIAGLVACILS